eukprot:CAMPEP_0177791246 /NCGR_PEP_ID=MMETSP0491_2-20121128/23823_1 /TAXON_ID=63592 /ORGANISM="Tetraselmis chuii, Strain PLY429" /LENGTH=171 /DNA_ID=CAMNT_0019313449 /DNA_START=257 /DNA_END=772 /DNA_ORIENTATION=-
MRPHEVLIVHTVQMIGFKDEDILHWKIAPRVHGPCISPDRIRCPTKPLFGFGSDGGGQHLHKASVTKGEAEVVRVRYVVVQGGGVVLREDVHLEYARVQTVAERDIDQTVRAADVDGSLRHSLGQRIQTVPRSAAQNQRSHSRWVDILLFQPLLEVFGVDLLGVELPPLLA